MKKTFRKSAKAAHFHFIVLMTTFAFVFGAYGQNITKVEYFVDTDPGFGLGTNVPVTPAANINNLQFSIGLNAVPAGFHTFYVRAKDENNRWSFSQVKMFYKAVITTATLPNVTKIEYFIDTDPGFGLGSNIPVTPSTNISNLQFTIDLTSVPAGFHTFFVRAKDGNGVWSFSQVKMFFKAVITTATLPNVTKIEYFIDTDPGFGLGSNIPVTPSTNISNLQFTIDLTSVPAGFHTFYVRAKDGNGRWSLSQVKMFYKAVITTATLPNVTKIEYFIDTDPGFGLGSNVPVTPSTNIPNLQFTINLTSVPTGFHTLYVRAKDGNGVWSLSQVKMFYKEVISAVALPNVTKVEYFFDSDPGMGMGTNIPVTPSTNIDNLSFTIDLSALPYGPHTVWIRAKDSAGKWSLVVWNTFTKEPPATTHKYYFVGNFNEGTGIGPALTEVLSCSAASGIFSNQSIITTSGACGAAPLPVFEFNAGGGLSYPNPSGLIGGNYTINIFFEFNSLSGYQRVIDFKNGVTDNGLYILNNCLNFYPSGNSGPCPYFEANKYYLITLVRNGTTNLIKVYVNGALFVNNYSDVSNQYVPTNASTPIILFRDNLPPSAGNCEDRDGKIKHFSVKSGTSTDSEVLETWNNICNISNCNPPVPTIAGPSSVCINSSGNVYSTEPGMIGYSWTISPGGVITSGAGTSSVTVTWTTAGSHNLFVTYSDPSGCQALNPGVKNVAVSTLPVPVIAGSSAGCLNSTGNSYSTELNMTGYQWTISAGGVIASGQGTNSILVSWTGAGSQNVSATYTDANGCTPSAPTVKSVTVTSLPIPSITGAESVCGVPSSNNTYTTESGMSGYSWIVSAGGTITGGTNTNSITVTWNTLGAQTVSVSYTGATGCTIPSPGVKNVTVSPAAPVSVTIVASATQVCQGTAVTFTATPVNGGTSPVYQWKVNGTNVGNNSPAFSYTPVNNDQIACSLISNVACPTGNPATSNSITITVNLVPTPTITGVSTVCSGTAGVTYTTEAGKSGYAWLISSGGAITAGTGTNMITVTWNTGGAQTVSVNYFKANGCSAASPTVLNVTVNQSPSPTITGPSAVCQGVTGVAYSTESGMSGYLWTISSGGAITGGTNASAITVTWNGAGTQQVSATYTHTNGCPAIYPMVKTVNVSPILPVSVSIVPSANPVCGGSSVTFIATPANGGANPVYQWMVNGVNAGSNSFMYNFIPSNNAVVTCKLISNLACTTGSPATSNSVTMTVNPSPSAPVSGGNIVGCTSILPAVLTATTSAGSTVDWYNAPSGGSLLLANSSTYSTSTAGIYYASSRNLTTGCTSNSRTAVSLTINTSIQYFLDADGDGYGNPDVSLFTCSPPAGYVLNGLDCNDNDPNVNPGAQYITYTGNVGFTNSIVSPLVGSAYTFFHFEADYFDATNSLPPSGYPRLMLDYEGNGSFTDPNDRVIIMTAADPLDLTTTNGKRYFAEVNGLPYGSGWKSRIVVNDAALCSTSFGPFDVPDVMHDPNLYIFANDISFSVPHPAISQNIMVNAVVHNESDFNALNFVVHLTNQNFPAIVYPDITVANLPAHQNTTVHWNITTPAAPAWCPMQVTVDYTNVIAENNELDNSAIRPFVNGNYQVAGAIVVHSLVSPASSYSGQYGYLNIGGRAWYTDLAVQLPDSTVAGATVECIITETHDTVYGYTNSFGYFSMYFPAPLTPGTYHVTTSVTDFTLTGSDTTHFHILPQIIPETHPNLSLNYCHSVEVQPVNPQSAGTATLVARVVNNGNANANGPIQVQFSYNTGGSWVGQYNGNLAAGQAVNVSATAPVPAPVSSILTAYADPNNLVSEWNESTADNSSTDNLCYDFQPVPLCSSNFWGTYCINQSTSIYCGLNVYHLYDADPVQMLFEVSGPGITGWQNLGIGTLNNATRNCSCPFMVMSPYGAFTFTQTGTYNFRMTSDPNNVYQECNESNNVLEVTVTVVTCISPPPPVRKPNLAFTTCKSLEVRPVNPAYPGNGTLVAHITNNGDTTATGPIGVEFTYSGGGGTFLTSYPGNLVPGQSVEVTIIETLPAPATTILTAVIDPANTIAEWSETDNAASENMCWEFQPVPHCGTNFWSRTYLVGQSTSLSVGLNVQHLYDANPVKVKYEVKEPGSAVWQNLGNALLNNATRNCWCPWVVVHPTAYTFFNSGTYTFRMTSDPDNNYTECDETNNVLIVTVDVLNGADMRILSQFINPSTLNPGVNDSVSMIVSYENIGNSNVGNPMKLRVKVDNSVLDDVYPVFGLATGDHASIAIPNKWSSAIPGAHVIRAIIDADNQVAEINETNNEATRAIIVGECANLYFQAFAASNSAPALNDYFHINSRIGNAGDVNCTATVKFFYINNSGDTIQIGQSGISVFAHDSVSLVMPWVVADAQTTIIGKIVNPSVQEFNPDDNIATAIIGGLNVTLTSTNACHGGNNGTLTAVAAGGAAPYLYLWSTGYIGQTLTAGAGSYTVTVTDNMGLSLSASGAIAEYAAVVPVITGPAATCYGASGNTYVTQPGMTAYSWIISPGGTVTAGGATSSNTATVTWNAGGAQSVSVNYTNQSGCAALTPTLYPVTVYPLFVVGSIAASQAICYNTVPAALTGTAPTGGNTPYSYQWQSSMNNVTFNNIIGATSQNYSPQTLTTTTYYRQVQSSASGCGLLTTNEATITVYPQFIVGSIGASQAICYNTVQAALTGIAPTGGNTAYGYQWQKSADNAVFSNISGATSLNFAPLALTATTYYRQVQTSASGCGSLTTNVVTIAVYPQFIVGSIGASQAICYNTVPAPLAGIAPTGGNLAYGYQWQKSADNAVFSNISAATSLNFAPLALTATTYYRQIQTSASSCGSLTTNVVTITVYPQFIVGSIGASQAICYNTVPAPLAGIAPTGGNTAYGYQWQKSADNAVFSNISGATSLNFAPLALTSTTYYRQVQTSASDCGSLTTNVVTITVYPQFVVGSIGASQAICYNTVPAALTGIAPTGGNTAYGYQWQKSADNAVFSNITGATSLNFAPTALTATTYYRQIQTSASGCGSL
ncbi:MAG: hypothetical protein NT004_09355, partial [Bacteroidetes bacterium]|nr:hypothetical protein [Bacteroidota bacterium]